MRVHLLTKTALLVVTRAIEDECCARALHPVLIGSFQRRRFYRAAAALDGPGQQRRADGDIRRLRAQPPAARSGGRDPGSRRLPLRREWAIICDAPDYPACATGWEHPGQDKSRDQDRIFEALWSVDPQVVRSAARIGTGLAAAASPDIPRRIAARLSEEPGPSSADLRRASGLFERTLDYLAGALQSANVEYPAP